jgi:7-carboxy-7-deazaguanine synthase
MSTANNTLVINEIFFSIQGESTRAGQPCVFVRLTGCDLRCSWCDTTYAFTEGTETSIDAILEKVKSYHCTLVEITGGEPLAQDNVLLLMKRLCSDGFDVMIETGGHHDISKIDSRVKRIVDIKCPGSKMNNYNRWENIPLLTANDEVKFVLTDKTDYEWAKTILQQYQLPSRCIVLFSPVYGSLNNRDLAEWMLRDNVKATYQLQLHKYIWDPTTRGV